MKDQTGANGKEIKAREQRVRRHLQKHGLALRKDRHKYEFSGNDPGYRIINVRRNSCVSGWGWITLNEAEEYAKVT